LADSNKKPSDDQTDIFGDSGALAPKHGQSHKHNLTGTWLVNYKFAGMANMGNAVFTLTMVGNNQFKGTFQDTNGQGLSGEIVSGNCDENGQVTFIKSYRENTVTLHYSGNYSKGNLIKGKWKGNISLNPYAAQKVIGEFSMTLANNGSANAMGNNTQVNNRDFTGNWLVTYDGVANNTVVNGRYQMQLTMNGNTFSGAFQYSDGSQGQILSGTLDENNKVNFTFYYSDSVQLLYAGQLQENGSVVGQWKAPPPANTIVLFDTSGNNKGDFTMMREQTTQ
jgi:hypothetical protein